MTEIFAIFIQFFIFLVLFSFPFTPKVLNNYLVLKKNLNIIDAHAINIIFFLYICLLFSFTNIDLKIFFKIYFSLSIIFIIYNYKRFYLKLNKTSLLGFFIFLLIVFSIFFSIAFNLRLESDGHLWLEKVLIFFNGYDIEYLKTVPTHPEYPHLGSFIWALFWKNSILELEYFGRNFQPYFYVVSIFLISNCLDFSNKNLKIFFILFFVLITYESYLFSGYQEYLVFSTLLISSRYIFLFDFKNLANAKLIFLILSILYINCWFKDEGVVYFLTFGSLFILFVNKSITFKIYCFVLMGFILILQYILQKYLIGLYGFPHNNLLQIFSELSNFKILLTKILKISFGFMVAFIKYPLWILILLSSLFHIFFVKKFETLTKYFIFSLIINFGFLMTIFLSFSNYEFYIRVTLDRLLFQTSGFYLILFFLTLKKFKILEK